MFFLSFFPQRINERQHKVVITDRMWARLLSSTNQPTFWSAKDVIEDKREEEPSDQSAEDEHCSDDNVINKEISPIYNNALKK